MQRRKFTRELHLKLCAVHTVDNDIESKNCSRATIEKAAPPRGPTSRLKI